MVFDAGKASTSALSIDYVYVACICYNNDFSSVGTCSRCALSWVYTHNIVLFCILYTITLYFMGIILYILVQNNSFVRECTCVVPNHPLSTKYNESSGSYCYKYISATGVQMVILFLSSSIMVDVVYQNSES